MAKKKTENNGRLIAMARDKFLEENPELLSLGTITVQYLKNRIERAFISGWDAAVKNRRSK